MLGAKISNGKDGTAPLALRISKDYKTNYCFTGQYILEKDWDEEHGKVKRTHPNSQKINNFLMKKLTVANDISFEANDRISSKGMKKKIVGPEVHKNTHNFSVLRGKDTLGYPNN